MVSSPWQSSPLRLSTYIDKEKCVMTKYGNHFFNIYVYDHHQPYFFLNEALRIYVWATIPTYRKKKMAIAHHKYNMEIDFRYKSNGYNRWMCHTYFDASKYRRWWSNYGVMTKYGNHFFNSYMYDHHQQYFFSMKHWGIMYELRYLHMAWIWQ